MKDENVIEVHDLYKSFKVYMDKGNTLKERSLFSNRRRYENREVLKGISFEVRKGEALGIIGHNGCGKSTTLKLLTRIMYPTHGTIEMKGRVSSLIELGAGFHPDMSGRENIYINASIFGLTRKEIEARLADIIAFSELEEYIDNPVRTYSSGMYMRLAFSVAINVDADILLIDEILAVGDISFQAKCFNQLRKLKNAGVTIVIVSHSLNQIEEICDRSVWIDDGVIREVGNPAVVNRHYTEFMNGYSMRTDQSSDNDGSLPETVPDADTAESPAADNKIRIGNVTVKDTEGRIRHDFYTGESAEIDIEYVELNDDHEMVSLQFIIVRDDGLRCYETNTFHEGFGLIDLKKNGTIHLLIEKLNLVSGLYWVEVAIRKPDAFPYDYKEKAFQLNMTSLDSEGGIARIDHKWDFEDVTVEQRV